MTIHKETQSKLKVSSPVWEVHTLPARSPCWLICTGGRGQLSRVLSLLWELCHQAGCEFWTKVTGSPLLGIIMLLCDYSWLIIHLVTEIWILKSPQSHLIQSSHFWMTFSHMQKKVRNEPYKENEKLYYVETRTPFWNISFLSFILAQFLWL